MKAEALFTSHHNTASLTQTRFFILLFNDIMRFSTSVQDFQGAKPVSIKMKAFIKEATHFSALLHSKDLILHKYLLTKGLMLICHYITTERPLSLISRQILRWRRRTALWRLPAVASINVTGKKETCPAKHGKRLRAEDGGIRWQTRDVVLIDVCHFGSGSAIMLMAAVAEVQISLCVWLQQMWRKEYFWVMSTAASESV